MSLNERHAAEAGVAYDPRCAPPNQLLRDVESCDDVEECIRRFHLAWQLPISNEDIKPSANDLLTATRWALNRITTLEHALRDASSKFGWLADNHLNTAFAVAAARDLADKYWQIQFGGKTGT